MTTVTLRVKDRKRKRSYLYLDYYPPYMDPVTRVTKRQEYLGLFIYTPPANSMQKEYNKKILERAETIRNKRAISVVNQEAGIFDSEVMRMDFLVFYKNKTAGKHKNWRTSYLHFCNYVNGKCCFGNINLRLCEGFREYLQNDARILNTNYKEKSLRALSSATASKSFLYFKRVLKEAFKEQYLKQDYAEIIDGIPARTEHRREFLTEDEVKVLYNTPCPYEPLRNASMFSIYTGLRLSDILDLKWKDITVAPDGKPCIRKMMVKGRREITLFISNAALKFCGDRGDDEQAVFKDFRKSMTTYPLKKWIEASGIPKHITFHCFRHTNATLLITKGVDIYTVSGMLTHTNVKTTQIYAHLVDSKKREAAETIDIGL